MFLLVFCISAFVRALRKLLENRIECGFQATYATESSRMTTFSVFEAPKWSPRFLWGASEGLLELLWHCPGRQLDPLGAPLGPPWELWGRSWALLARSCSRLFPKIRATELRRTISNDLGSISVDFPHRKPPKSFREPAKSSRKPAPQRRAPNAEQQMRVRRFREANSIRRTLRLRRERSV